MLSELFTREQLGKLPLLLSMPIHFCSLVLETTNCCNSKCGICYQSAGSEGRNRIDLIAAKKAIEESAILENVGSRLHIAGGEAFLFPEDCFELFRTAKSAGYSLISATSNCFWGATLDKARKMCEKAKESGLNYLELSWDYWHGEHIPASSVSNCLVACREYEIMSNLRLLTTKKHDMEESICRLDPEALKLASNITSGPVLATGRAVEVLKKDDFYPARVGIAGTCHSMLNLTVDAHGDVFPCCSGFDVCKECSFGNINEESIQEIVLRMNKSLLLRQLVFWGPKSFLPLLEKNGVKVEKCSTFCTFCVKMFSDEKIRNIIMAHVPMNDSRIGTNSDNSLSKQAVG